MEFNTRLKLSQKTINQLALVGEFMECDNEHGAANVAIDFAHKVVRELKRGSVIECKRPNGEVWEIGWEEV